MAFKTMVTRLRIPRKALIAFMLFLGICALIFKFSNLQTSLAVRNARKEGSDLQDNRFGINSLEEKGKLTSDEHDNNDKLLEIEQLLRQLNNRMDANKKKIEHQNATKTQTLRGRVTALKDNIEEAKLLPLDFSKVHEKTKGNLEDLLETPNNPPTPPRGVPMDKMPYMMEPEYKPSKCPKTISSITKYSSWFKERFKPGLKMFLDVHDIYNFTNYHKLAHYGMPFGFATVDRNIVGAIVNNVDFINPPINNPTDRCVRCAVIGSGGILNGSNAGEQIDSHDFVFRVNRALTSDQYAKDVGRKTSFYEFFPESQNVWTVNDQNAAFLFTNFKKVDLYYAESMLRKDVKTKDFNVDGELKPFFRPPLLDPRRVKITHPDFFRYIFTHFLNLKGYRPTTGALVVFTAIYMCDEVTIYGFGYDPRFTMHYYDTAFVKHTEESTGSHDVHNERELWNKLHTEGVIKLFKRDF